MSSSQIVKSVIYYFQKYHHAIQRACGSKMWPSIASEEQTGDEDTADQEPQVREEGKLWTKDEGFQVG